MIIWKSWKIYTDDSRMPEIKEDSTLADYGQSLMSLLLTFCAHFCYYTNEAISSNCINKDFGTQQFWMVTTIYWSLTLLETGEKKQVSNRLNSHLYGTSSELMWTQYHHGRSILMTPFWNILWVYELQSQLNSNPKSTSNSYAHYIPIPICIIQLQPFSSLSLLLLLLWVSVSSLATTEAFFVSLRPLSLAPLQHTHGHTQTFSPPAIEPLLFLPSFTRGEDITFLAF